MEPCNISHFHDEQLGGYRDEIIRPIRHLIGVENQNDDTGHMLGEMTEPGPGNDSPDILLEDVDNTEGKQMSKGSQDSEEGDDVMNSEE